MFGAMDSSEGFDDQSLQPQIKRFFQFYSFSKHVPVDLKFHLKNGVSDLIVQKTEL